MDGNKTAKINVKNFHGSLTTVLMAQNDTSETANSTQNVIFALTSEVMLPTGVMKLSQVCVHVLCASRL